MTTAQPSDPRSPQASKMQGHWLLARLGKRILRPGGRALTARLLREAAPSSRDDIVEFGPGVGATAELLLAAGPRSYRGVDPSLTTERLYREQASAHRGGFFVTG